MKLEGWIFMLSAWTLVTGLFVYCYYRILFTDSGQTSE